MEVVKFLKPMRFSYVNHCDRTGVSTSESVPTFVVSFLEVNNFKILLVLPESHSSLAI